MLFLTRENGQGLTEYALLLVLMALFLLALLSFFGQFIFETYERITAIIAGV